ncbi:hypothetical protein SAICODRAFT_32048 [Saitoella complicata NRRL Y-17804]|uniref:uncharacterized protein n=1 Tax=Saitoella complicata (strain BCRC 22490 / CBS 7301 / JCM 7358 / NBRC 10748 / NRRL Y-17804) TaxID=698492 RepID=UPI000867E57C|nr:uncharacterized protein SAICODRAFT_32048 [Saitoella complicata NRRL Y-17804]ODQ50311.1 hypothetical protein SAICODRAFT_32048 [Saitoella complicata NRRL Y-17804]
MSSLPSPLLPAIHESCSTLLAASDSPVKIADNAKIRSLLEELGKEGWLKLQKKHSSLPLPLTFPNTASHINFLAIYYLVAFHPPLSHFPNHRDTILRTLLSLHLSDSPVSLRVLTNAEQLSQLSGVEVRKFMKHDTLIGVEVSERADGADWVEGVVGVCQATLGAGVERISDVVVEAAPRGVDATLSALVTQIPPFASSEDEVLVPDAALRLLHELRTRFKSLFGPEEGEMGETWAVLGREWLVESGVVEFVPMHGEVVKLNGVEWRAGVLEGSWRVRDVAQSMGW